MSEMVRLGLERVALLGLTPVGCLALLVDASLLLVTTGWLVGRWVPADDRVARRCAAMGVVFLSLVVGSATLLGATRWLGARPFVLLHAALALAALVLARSRHESLLALIGAPVVAATQPIRSILRRKSWRVGRRAEAALLAAILLVLGFYLVLALFTVPLNFDANTYRLSRVALWLQHGDIYHFETYDTRFSYAGQNADLVMLWLVSFFRSGYPLVALVQFAGGVLACIAAWELAAQCGLGRCWRLGAVAMLLGIPTAATQFFTAQTDLFTAGCLAAGLVFLRPALERLRTSDWVLLGLGGGLALGTKATLLYWGPGLILIGCGWAWVERSRVRPLVRGVLVAATAALPLCGFNFLLNQWDFERPVAPSREVKRSFKPSATNTDRWLASNAAILAGQLLDPMSNPFLPATVTRAASSAAFESAIASRSDAEWFERDLRRRASWLKAGLSEDYASFGVLTMTVAGLGAAIALRRFASRGRPAAAGRAVGLAAGVAAWFAAAVVWQPMFTLHQFRYFCIVAPATAVLGAYGLAALRSTAGKAIAVLVVVGQLATAAYSGVNSRHHGLRVLLEPSSSPHFTLFEHSRAAAAALGDRPRRLVVALSRDSTESWLAPFLRSGVAHQITLASSVELATARCASALLELRGADALLTTPRMLELMGTSGAVVEGVPRSSDEWVLVRTAVFQPSGTARSSPTRSATASGVFADGWTATEAHFNLESCAPGRWTLEIGNPSPLARRAELAGARGAVAVELPPLGRARLELPVRASERVRLRVVPPFVPAQHARSPDERQLGVLLARPELVPDAGVDGDGWLRSDSRLTVRRWLDATLSLTLANPTPLSRVLTVLSSMGSERYEVGPGGLVQVEIPVRFDDVVTLSARPALVPERELAGATDDRPLGLLLAAGDRRRLGLPAGTSGAADRDLGEPSHAP